MERKRERRWRERETGGGGVGPFIQNVCSAHDLHVMNENPLSPPTLRPSEGCIAGFVPGIL